MPAAQADNPVAQSEVPPVRERPSPDGPLSLDDVQLSDELFGPGLCARDVALSLAHVRAVESRCISRLLAVHQRFCEEGGRLVVHSVWPRLMDALRFLRLDEVLHLARDEAAARRLLQASEPVGAEQG
jgi:anti-anti-sigma regulatory factor